LARRIESPEIPGIGETLLEEPDPGPPMLAALVCHPHPLFGGTMHNKVVYRMARGLRQTGAVVLRFNFRKTGEISEGLEDAAASLAWLRARYPDLPYALAGFSFGARVITRLGCENPGARFLLAAGYPTRWGTQESCPTAKIFIQSTNDQYAPRSEFEAMFTDFAEPKRLRWIEARDHFFDGALDAFEEAVGSEVGSAVNRA
jgi:alpha/beta superfamily hydrolase